MRKELFFDWMPEKTSVYWDTKRHKIWTEPRELETREVSASKASEVPDPGLDFVITAVLKNPQKTIIAQDLTTQNFVAFSVSQVKDHTFFVENKTGKVKIFYNQEILRSPGGVININPIAPSGTYEDEESQYADMQPLEHYFKNPGDEGYDLNASFSSLNLSRLSLNVSLNTSRLSVQEVDGLLKDNPQLQEDITNANRRFEKLLISKSQYENFRADMVNLWSLHPAKAQEYITKITQCNTVPQMIKLLQNFTTECNALYEDVGAIGNDERQAALEYKRSFEDNLQKAQSLIKTLKLADHDEVVEAILGYAQQGGNVEALRKEIGSDTSTEMILYTVEDLSEHIFTDAFKSSSAEGSNLLLGVPSYGHSRENAAQERQLSGQGPETDTESVTFG